MALRKLTYDDYVLLPHDGSRHEIIDGEHFVTAAPSLSHQRTVLNLAVRLQPFVKTNRLGEVFIAPLAVVLSPHDVVQPDLLFVSTERAGILTEKNVQGAPDLVVEVLSPSTRRLDETLKLERYAELGVREYWIIDPQWQWRTLKLYRRLARGSFGSAVVLSAAAGDLLSTPLLPGLAIPMAEIFE
jgi:Uma2 family endonuclease